MGFPKWAHTDTNAIFFYNGSYFLSDLFELL